MRLPDELDANARVMIRDDGTDVRARRAINLTGTGAATVTIADNPTTEAVDVTIDVTAGEEPITDHGALTGLEDDDHTQYQLRTEKSAADGYASLDTGSLVPTAELGTGTASNTTFLRGDQTWATPSGAGASHFEDLFGNYYDEENRVFTGYWEDWTETARVVSVEASPATGPWIATMVGQYNGDPDYQYAYFSVYWGDGGYALNDNAPGLTGTFAFRDNHSESNSFDPDYLFSYTRSGVLSPYGGAYLFSSVTENTDSTNTVSSLALYSQESDSFVSRSITAHTSTGSYGVAPDAYLWINGDANQTESLLWVIARDMNGETPYGGTAFSVMTGNGGAGAPGVIQCVPTLEPSSGYWGLGSYQPPVGAGLLCIWLDEENDELKFRVRYSDLGTSTIKTGSIALT